MFEHVAIDVVSGVGWLRFDRPRVNAFDRQMLDETEAAFDLLLADETARVIVLGSTNPKYFSAGADLETFRNISSEAIDDWVTTCHRLARRIRSGPKPVIACIRGVAVGGGLEMSLHADRRFSARDAQLGQPEVNIAFVPPVAGTQALVRLVGRSAALKILYSGELIDAEEALKIGLVDEIHDAGEIEATVQVFCEQLATKPPNALAAIRRCLADGGDTTFAEGMAMEAHEACVLAEHPNFREGIEAFLNRRPPNWT
ncbi:enoyl-CoA hydratase/isomerase family protein [Sulfitobacter sp. TBRI5]|uniref:enoyl-CoA hydratase/isomerase family protein n=1 Tax=Sulfitobacter sp. TBRI5 TaxID=2989732 RepID=UPI003D9B0873